jgi:hypothetical protein
MTLKAEISYEIPFYDTDFSKKLLYILEKNR